MTTIASMPYVYDLVTVDVNPPALVKTTVANVETGSFTLYNYGNKAINVTVTPISFPDGGTVTFSTPTQFSLGVGGTKLVQYTCRWLATSKASLFEFAFEISDNSASGRQIHRAAFKRKASAPKAPSYSISVNVGEWYSVVPMGADSREGTEYWTTNMTTADASKAGAELIKQAKLNLRSGLGHVVNDLDPAFIPTQKPANK